MASLVAPLASGINGAASGTVEFYLRGTNTTATVYSDKSATTAVTTHTLDSNGGIVRYVKASVDVVVKDSTGATVREFCWEDHAANVEVTNAGFTGTSAASASTVAGGRTTLDTVLSSLYTSLGALDGKVLVNGAGQYLKDAIGNTSSVFFNVKATSYGADGDGTSDDTSSIQTAINAAVDAGGGIVYFPPGTYKITSSLSITSGKICLLGVTPAATVIKQFTSGTNGWVNITGANCTIMNLGFDRDTTAMTGRVVQTTVAGTVLHNVAFAGFNGTHIYMANAAARVHATACGFSITETSGRIIDSSAGGAIAAFAACQFNVTAASTAGLFGEGSHSLTGCNFSISAVATPIFNGTSGRCSQMGGYVTCTAGAGTITWVNGPNMTLGGVYFESGTTTLSISPLVDLGNVASGIATTIIIHGSEGYVSATRQARYKVHTVTGTTVTPDSTFQVNEIIHSSGASLTIANPGGAAVGATRLTILYKNSTGGSITPSFGTNYKTGTIAAVASGSMAVYDFIQGATSGVNAGKWCQIGGNAAVYVA